MAAGKQLCTFSVTFNAIAFLCQLGISRLLDSQRESWCHFVRGLSPVCFSLISAPAYARHLWKTRLDSLLQATLILAAEETI